MPDSSELEHAMRSAAEMAGGPTPNWAPLRPTLPREWRNGFMWMGSTQSAWGTIHLYKHGITRTYFNLDKRGNAYVFDAANGTYEPIPLQAVVSRLLIDLAILGFAPTQPYDDRFIAERNRRLSAIGYTTFT